MQGAETYVQRTMAVPGWGVESPVIQTADGVYFPLNVLCAVLDIDAQKQRARLKEHAVLGRLVRQLHVQTKARGGRQLAWCIEKRGIGFWLGSIQLASVRPSIVPRLLDFQEALVDAADRLFFGEIDAIPDVVRYARSLEDRLGRVEERVFVPDGDE